MYTTKSLKLTTKATKILMVIQKANERIDEIEQEIYEGHNVNEVFNAETMRAKLKALTEKLATAHCAQSRLINYYGATLMALVYNGLKQNAFEYLDKPSKNTN
jgi:hypothetical protein